MNDVWSDPKPVIEKIAGLLESLAQSTAPTRSQTKLHRKWDELFCCVTIPVINVLPYINRFFEKGSVSISCLITAVIYIDLLLCVPGYTVHCRSIHRIISACLLLAYKMLEDCPVSNFEFAVIAGVPLAELNRMEIVMLELLNYDLFVTKVKFTEYADLLENREA